MGNYRKPKVWERAHRSTLKIYDVTKMFPREELFGLTSPLRRSASAIPANIAERCGRNGVAEPARFLRIAVGSANELDYHLLLAHDLGLLTKDMHSRRSTEAEEINSMLAALITKLRPTQDC